MPAPHRTAPVDSSYPLRACSCWAPRPSFRCRPGGLLGSPCRSGRRLQRTRPPTATSRCSVRREHSPGPFRIDVYSGHASSSTPPRSRAHLAQEARQRRPTLRRPCQSERIGTPYQRAKSACRFRQGGIRFRLRPYCSRIPRMPLGWHLASTPCRDRRTSRANTPAWTRIEDLRTPERRAPSTRELVPIGARLPLPPKARRDGPISKRGR
jgi:hypothetical protein